MLTIRAMTGNFVLRTVVCQIGRMLAAIAFCIVDVGLLAAADGPDDRHPRPEDGDEHRPIAVAVFVGPPAIVCERPGITGAGWGAAYSVAGEATPLRLTHLSQSPDVSASRPEPSFARRRQNVARRPR